MNWRKPDTATSSSTSRSLQLRSSRAMLDRTFQRDPSSTDTSIEILYKLATVVCLIWEASFLVTIRRYCDPRLTWRLRAATPGPRTRLTAPWKGSVKPTDLFTWALLKHHQGVHRTHCQYLQGAVYRPQAVLQSPEVCPQNHPLQLSLGAKGQGYTFLSALVYCQPSSSLHQESESLSPLPHGQA